MTAQEAQELWDAAEEFANESASCAAGDEYCCSSEERDSIGREYDAAYEKFRAIFARITGHDAGRPDEVI